MQPLQWLAQHDRNYAALRRAARTAIIMPAMFAVGDKVLDNPVAGDVRCVRHLRDAAAGRLHRAGASQRLQAQAALGAAGCVFVVLGTLVSQSDTLSVTAMVVVAFAVIFAGVVSSTLAGATTSLLLGFILPVSLPAPTSTIPDRLAGWGLAAVVAFVAIGVLWPAPVRDPLRAAASAACKAIAARLRAEVTLRLSDGSEVFVHGLEEAATACAATVAALHQTFLATPYRPTGLSTATRTVVRLVDELGWLDAIVVQSSTVMTDSRPQPGSLQGQGFCCRDARARSRAARRHRR